MNVKIMLLRYPAFRSILKRLYNAIMITVSFSWKTKPSITVGRNIVLCNYKNTFWGYYDKSPINPIFPSLIILHANNANSKCPPNPEIDTDIVLYDLQNERVIKVIGTTRSWNWQQGSRLQWIDENRVAYNRYNSDTDSYETVISSIKENEVDEIHPFPIQNMCNDYLISIDYHQLSLIRPDYGYFNRGCQDYEVAITIYNIKESAIFHTITINDIIRDITDYSTNGKFNHVIQSPDQKEFIYLFRYVSSAGERKHLVYKFNLEVKENTAIIKNNIISHYNWLSNNEIILWGIVKGKSDYYIYNKSTKSLAPIMSNLRDGHPSLYMKGAFISDTYPNSKRVRDLFLYDCDSKTKITLNRYYEPIGFENQNRCDLHPTIRWFDKQAFITVDNIVNDRRCLSLYNISNNPKCS